MTAAGDGRDGQEQATAPPSDPRALEREIEQTREQLGETVAALVAKADVKARATEKARALSSRLTGKAGHAGERMAGQAGRARHQLEDQAGRGRTLLAAKSAGGQQAAHRAREMVPTARRAAQRAARTLRQHPVPAAAIAAGLVLLALAAARGRRR